VSQKLLTTNTHTGLALFALGIIIFFGQGYVLSFIGIVASSLMPSDNPYETISQAYFAAYGLALMLIILGVLVFMKDRKQNASSISSADITEAERSNS